MIQEILKILYYYILCNIESRFGIRDMQAILNLQEFSMKLPKYLTKFLQVENGLQVTNAETDRRLNKIKQKCF